MPRPSSREKLLDSAEKLFAAHGVGRVSMRAIQSAAGLSVGSLQYHFKTEAELVAAVMERRLSPMIERHEKELEAVASKVDPSSEEVIGALIRPLALRFDLAWETMLGSLARASDLSPSELENHVSELIDYLSGALAAPQTSKRPNRASKRLAPTGPASVK